MSSYAIIYDTGPEDEPSENYYAHFGSVAEAKRLYADLHRNTDLEYRGAYVVQLIEPIPSPGDMKHDLKGHGFTRERFRLFYVHGEDEDMNLDLFLITSDAAAVTALWREHVVKEGWSDTPPDPIHIMEIEAATVHGPTRVLDWHKSGGLRPCP